MPVQVSAFTYWNSLCRKRPIELLKAPQILLFWFLFKRVLMAFQSPRYEIQNCDNISYLSWYHQSPSYHGLYHLLGLSEESGQKDLPLLEPLQNIHLFFNVWNQYIVLGMQNTSILFLRREWIHSLVYNEHTIQPTCGNFIKFGCQASRKTRGKNGLCFLRDFVHSHNRIISIAAI